MQILADLIDTFEGLVGKPDSGAGLKAVLEGNRLPKLLGNLERNVKGPYFFGEKPSVPDFVLTALVDWSEITTCNVLKDKGVAIPWQTGKLDGVVSAIRGLESYGKNTVPKVKDDFIKGPDHEFFAGL